MATEQVSLICINCPLGCPLVATVENGVVVNVTGNTCPRGKKYAEDELTAPTRMLTSTVKCKKGVVPLLPVVSKTKLPKDSVIGAANFLRGVTVTAPVKAGDVIVANILGTGCDIVASRDLKRA